MTIDEMCDAALKRMADRAEVRYAAFERQSREQYLHVRRSLAQRFRRLREELIGRGK